MDTSALNTESRSKLVDDLRAVIRDAEDLINKAGSQTEDKFQSARSRIDSTLQNARSGLSNAKAGLSTAQESLVSRTKQAAATTDQYVTENPWRSVGAVAIAGLLIGLLVGRK
jgi:ElaB/YqjD/DUF883 family membrane-anchored ribosome-binding protein